MVFPEFIQLFEAVLVDDLLEMPVGVVADAAFVVEYHHHAIFR